MQPSPVTRTALGPVLLCLLAALLTPVARADIGIVLADPTTIGASNYTHAGHALVYLSGVCAESPVRARLCQPGEQGSIVTTYPDFRESEDFAWNLVPLSLYLQGSLTPGHRLLYASRPVKDALELSARTRFFRPVCPPGHCPQLPHSYWRDLVAATVDRDVFLFTVRTTPAQDAAAVDWLNHFPNTNHYNGIFNNCAVFVRDLVNTLYPHAVHRDLPNDLGMMAPKAAARSFTHWALRHPELGFRTVHIAQQPSDLPRCSLARSGTETAIHTNKYLIPAALIGDHEVAGSFFVAYFFTGRFGLLKSFKAHPDADVLAFETEAKAAHARGDDVSAFSLQASAAAARSRVLGTPSAWALLRSRLAELPPAIALPAAAPAEQPSSPPTAKHPFSRALADGVVIVDDAGDPWLSVVLGGSPRRVGLSSANLLAPASDPALAYQLIRDRVAFALAAQNHAQETMLDLEDDWSLLEQAHTRWLAGTAAPAPTILANSPASRPLTSTP